MWTNDRVIRLAWSSLMSTYTTQKRGGVFGLVTPITAWPEFPACGVQNSRPLYTNGQSLYCCLSNKTFLFHSSYSYHRSLFQNHNLNPTHNRHYNNHVSTSTTPFSPRQRRRSWFISTGVHHSPSSIWFIFHRWIKYTPRNNIRLLFSINTGC